ncbi:hypothetical protein EZS27_039037, partial [termite gut metagenome]
ANLNDAVFVISVGNFAIIGFTLGIFAYVSSPMEFADIPAAREL